MPGTLMLVTVMCGPGTLVTVYKWLMTLRSRGVRLGAILRVFTVRSVTALEKHYRVNSRLIVKISMNVVSKLTVTKMLTNMMHSRLSKNTAVATCVARFPLDVH